MAIPAAFRKERQGKPSRQKTTAAPQYIGILYQTVKSAAVSR
jgi:hypothetical protein